MDLKRLIPVCLISTLMGLILPRVLENPAHLMLGAAGYLGLCVLVDRVFGSGKAPTNPA